MSQKKCAKNLDLLAQSAVMKAMRPHLPAIFAILICALPAENALGQDVEPRRWTPLPTGLNVIGAGYAFTHGDIAFDPVLQIEDAKVDMHTLLASYTRAYALFGRSARFDLLVPLQRGYWSGLLQGNPASTTRQGFGDPSFRLSINLYGAPAVSMEEFRQRAQTQPINTVVGAAVSIGAPLGDYLEDRLLNLGQNRFVVRPQLGVLHTRGKWSYELTGSTYFFSKNDEFFNGNTLEQDPIHALQAHIIRVFKPGLWASLSAAYGWRGETRVNNVPGANDKSDLLAALSVGFPVTRSQSMKFVYLKSETHRFTGANLDTFVIAWSRRF